MSNFVWILILVGVLTLIGCATLLFITLRYYWGDRGTPPATGELRRQQKEEEMRLRAKQIEYAETHPVKPRSPDLFDNRKIP